MSEQRHDGDLPGSSGTVTRRAALQLGAVAAGVLALEIDPAAADPGSQPEGERARESSFDEGWRFFRGDAPGAEAPSFDDGGWRTLDLPHDWSIEDLPYAPPADGGVTSDPSLLVTQVPPTIPGLPQVIGPFDPANSANGGSIGYTVGGIGWYRKQFRLPGLDGADDRHVELRSTASTRTRTSGSTACIWASIRTATRRSRST